MFTRTFLGSLLMTIGFAGNVRASLCDKVDWSNHVTYKVANLVAVGRGLAFYRDGFSYGSGLSDIKYNKFFDTETFRVTRTISNGWTGETYKTITTDCNTEPNRCMKAAIKMIQHLAYMKLHPGESGHGEAHLRAFNCGIDILGEFQVRLNKRLIAKSAER